VGRRAGIDLGGTKIEGIVLEDDGAVCARGRIPTPRGDYHATLDAIAGLLADLEAEAGPAETVGVGIPGAVSPATGRVKNANSTWLIGHPLEGDLERRLGRPVRLDNDANCFALSEAVDGAGAGRRTVFGVILGTGVGGGIVVDERVLVGPNAIAGEWGHNPMPWPAPGEWPGPPCYCGRTGCIETFLSGPGFAADHARHTRKVLRPEEVAADATVGEPEATASLARYEDRLARALASVVNLLDPDGIVLGGGLSNLDSLYDRIPALWLPWVFSDRVDTPILRAVHGDAGGVRGAAWLWPRT
jgi:fructokinase